MEAITFICTLCGAAALSRGIVQLIDHLGRRRFPVDKPLPHLYNIFI